MYKLSDVIAEGTAPLLVHGFSPFPSPTIKEAGFTDGQHLQVASLVAQMIRNLSAMQETQVRSLGRKDPLEKEMATHPSVLVWRIPWTEEPVGLQSMGLQNQTQLSNFHTHTHTQGTSQGNRNHPSDCLDADKGTERFTGSPQVMDESQLASHMVAWVEGGDGTGGVSGSVF